MKHRFFGFLTILYFFFATNLFAQQTNNFSSGTVYKVAVIAPLYLDSVFTDNKLRSENTLPKFIMPAVDFVQGAEIAFDSLATAGKPVDAYIYDSKSVAEPLLQLLHSKKLDSFNLIIGAVKDVDFMELAAFSASRSIPFISAVFPNDGGITGDPYLAIVNSTLKAHCEGIYSYVLQNHGTDKIYLIRQRGVQEDKIAGYFKALNNQDGKPLLNIQTINFDTTFSVNAFQHKLDSNRNSVIIGGSLDEAFAKNLTDACFSSYKNYPLTLIGMPNWDGFKFFAKPDDYKDFAIHLTSPFNNSPSNAFSYFLSGQYDERYKTKPTDMALKGFENSFYFTNLLFKYPSDLMQHLNDSSIKVFNDFNFKPILPSVNSAEPDYYENKHLYIMRILNGNISREW